MKNMDKNPERMKKKVIDDFMYMSFLSEAKTYTKLSQKRGLTDDEIRRYKEVCKLIIEV